jgi:hypothetical protein
MVRQALARARAACPERPPSFLSLLHDETGGRGDGLKRDEPSISILFRRRNNAV